MGQHIRVDRLISVYWTYRTVESLAVRWRQGAACGNRDIDLHESERQSTLTTAHCTTARDHYRTALAILSENWSVAAVATHNNLRPVWACILHIYLFVTIQCSYSSNQLSVLHFYIICSLNINSTFSSKFWLIKKLCFITTSTELPNQTISCILTCWKGLIYLNTRFLTLKNSLSEPSVWISCFTSTFFKWQKYLICENYLFLSWGQTFL